MQLLKDIFQILLNSVLQVFSWIMGHKKIVCIYIPALCALLLSIYAGIIYLSWLSDKEQAMDKMARYKQLIDRTEEMKRGLVYQASDVDLKTKVVDIPTRIYDKKGEIIGEFFEQKREIIPFKDIPGTIVKGVIASEDRDFYQHAGINYKGIARAMLINIYHLRVVQGGSTITQQLAKVLFTDMERSFKRKIYEAFCAKEIEHRYDKQDILSMYLNLIYFGNGAYGVESTAKMFFGKPAKECNETECAMIVATISNPMIYSPLSNLKNSIRKTRRILKSLTDAGFITQRRAAYQYKKFLRKWDVQFDEQKVPVSSLIGSFVYSSYRVNRAPFFNEQIRRLLVERFGEDIVKKGGLSVYTTIDAEKQDVALAALREGIEKQRAYHLKRSKQIKNERKAQKEKEKSEQIEGALVALNPDTGEIESYVGGYRFTAKSQLDHVSQSRRQPGSSFKPLVYCSAVENRDVTPATMFVDEKTVFEGGYAPNNYSYNFAGNIIAREALRRSINIVAVKVLQKTGYDTVFDYLQKALDLSNAELRKRFGRTLSLALGTYEISPLENAILHATIENGGKYIKPYGIRYVEDYNKNVVWNYEEEVKKEIMKKRDDYGTIIDPIAAAITVSMLKGVLQEGGTAYWTARRYKINFPAAGKTGTSTNFNDAWFVGYTSQLITAVWIGNNKGAISLGRSRSGGALSAPVWGKYISTVFNGNKPADFSVPEEGIAYQTICLDSGLVPRNAGSCPRIDANELFYSGSEPGEYCNLHLDEHAEQSATGTPEEDASNTDNQ